MAKKYTADFTAGPIYPALIRFGTPLILANILQVLYNIVDMAIVGNVNGKIGLSAVSVGGDVVSFLTYIVIGFGHALQIILSHYVGAKRHSDIEKLIGTAFSFIGGCAVLISVACLVFRRQILNIMNTPAESYDEALIYSTICIAGLIFIFGYNIVGSVLRGLGDSKHPLMFVGISAGMNVVLDLLFVWVLDMHAAGAAAATVISQGFSFICCIIFILKKKEAFGLSLGLSGFLRFDPKMLPEFVRLGIPMALRAGAVHISKLLVNSLINSYGVEVSAFVGVASRINNIANIVANALNTAGGAMVGQNIGAGKYGRVPKIMRSVFSITIFISVAASLMLIFCPKVMYSIFTTDPDVIRVGMEYIPFGVIAFLAQAFRSAANTVVAGSGNSRVNLCVALMDALAARIGLVLLFGLALGMGYHGFWLGDVLAGFVPFIIGIVFFLSGKWKKDTFKTAE